MTHHLHNPPPDSCFAGTTAPVTSLVNAGFTPPSWEHLMAGHRPPQRPIDEDEPCQLRHCWQHLATKTSEYTFRHHHLWPRLSPSEQALLRSQSGPGAGVVFSAIPYTSLTTLEPHIFRTLLICRLRLPISRVSHLPVWPSPWLVLPPPSSVPTCRDIRYARLCSGICSSTYLSWGWGSSLL